MLICPPGELLEGSHFVDGHRSRLRVLYSLTEHQHRSVRGLNGESYFIYLMDRRQTEIISRSFRNLFLSFVSRTTELTESLIRSIISMKVNFSFTSVQITHQIPMKILRTFDSHCSF